MSDEQKVDETTTASDTGTTGTEMGPDGQPFDAARAQRAIEAQRAEIRALKAQAKEAEELKKRLQAIEDKDKSEVERLAGTARETSEKLTAAEARAQDLAIRLAVERAARKLNFIDEDDAFRLIDRSAVETDDTGDPTNVDALLKDLAKAKPHLVKAEADDPKDKRPGTVPVPSTPKPTSRPTGRQEDVDQRARVLQSSGAYPRF